MHPSTITVSKPDWVKELEAFVSEVIERTSDYVWVRREDRLLILRPNTVHFLNETAAEILYLLYSGMNAREVIKDISSKYGVEEKVVAEDIKNLLKTLLSVLKRQYSPVMTPSLRKTSFGKHRIVYPVLSEIALTYRCQNRCVFCYASSPRETNELNTEQFKKIIWKTFHQAKCPTLSFTGGEPTLREDLPELIEYAKSLGEDKRRMRVNLITNGIKCAKEEYVKALVKAGLDSAQVSLEAGSAEIHDVITGNNGSFNKTVRGVKNLRDAGIHVHTNTTICSLNKDHIKGLIDFLVDELNSEYFSANMVIRTGTALENDVGLTYTEMGKLLPEIISYSRDRGIKFVWYSPIPYCIFNPVAHGLGSKSCAACHGLLSISPEGEVLPCSSFSKGVGNILKQEFESIWFNKVAEYWREKKFVPPPCKGCKLVDVCSGACPLYWDSAGSFKEINKGNSSFSYLLWRIERRLFGKVFGVGK
ncbi:MAG TPA: radical SAM protein [Candidatus Korarchaeota archaeon]|nr:radical SAM protein [Candidatus Korarchaeota archaeon]